MNNRIKELRKALNLTAEKFGARIGVTRSTISNLESGHRNVTEQTILLIVNEFNVNEKWLRDGKGEMFVNSDEFSLDEFCKNKDMSELELSILKSFFNIPKDIRKKALEFFIKKYTDLKPMENTKDTLEDLYELSGVDSKEDAELKEENKNTKKQA